MDSELIGHMLERVGPLWLLAIFGMFVSAVCESSKPKAEEGEEKSSGGIALVIAGIASLITPILLFAHGFWTLGSMQGIEVSSQMVLEVVLARKTLVIGLFASLAAVAIAGSIVGWIIRAAAPGLGKALNLAAVPLALVTLALTAYVSYEAALGLFALVTSR